MSGPFCATKIFAHPDRLASLLAGEPCPPVTVELDLTNRCGHACPECAGGKVDPTAALDTIEALDYVHQIRDLGAKGLILTGGGEPLAHPDCAAVATEAARVGLDVGLITNGGLLDDDSIATLVACCTWIRVSLDAGEEHQYRRVHGRGGGEFRRVLARIAALGQRKQDAGPDCTIGVGYLLDAGNLAGAPVLAAQLADMPGVDYLQLRPFHGRATPLAATWALAACARYQSATFHVVSSDQKYGVQPGRDYTRCAAAEVCAVIAADSSMPLCCHYRGDAAFSLGHLRGGATVAELWYAPRHRELLDGMDVSHCLPLCRGDAINRTVHQIGRPVQHPAFL
jgi:pyruvate-formate lyase-activating enzyme